jgi:ligand-binding sensor domain-containing protein
LQTGDGLKTLDQGDLMKGQIRFIPPPPLYKAGENRRARYLYFDREDNLWIVDEQGTLKINNRGQTKSFTTENGLSVNFQSSIFQDRENIMWFLNQQTGMSKLANHGYELQAFVKPGFISDIYADHRSDSVWFVDPMRKKLLLKYPNGSREFSLDFPEEIDKMVSSGKTNYFAGNGGIYESGMNSKKNKIDLKFLDSSAIGLSRGASCILTDNNGNVVFLNWYINAVIKNKTISYPLGSIADQFFITPRNRLWVATRNRELFQFQLNPDDTVNYFQLIKHYKGELPYMSPRSVTVDKNGILWIGSRDHGLFCFYFDKSFQLTSWQQFTTKNGLSDNFISYLHSDAEGNIWACSPVGLDKLQLKNRTVFIENITRANNMYLNVMKIVSSKNGIKWIRSSAGIIKIAPLVFPMNTYRAKIFFTNIDAGSKKNTGCGISSYTFS